MARPLDEGQGGVRDPCVDVAGIAHGGVGVLRADHHQCRYRDPGQQAPVVGAFGAAPECGGRTLGRCGRHHRQDVGGDLRPVGEGVRGDHLGQHLLGVAGHALAEQPGRHVMARGPALLGLRRGEGVGEHQAPDPLREEPVALHDDLASHGQAAEHEALDPEPVQQGAQVACEGLQRGGAGDDRAPPVAPEVRRDHPPSGLAEVLDLRAPHRAVEGMAVYEHQRITAALVLVTHRDLAAIDRSHGSSPSAVA